MYVGPVGDAGWTFAHDLGRKAIRGGCFIDVKSRFDTALLRDAGLTVWRL